MTAEVARVGVVVCTYRSRHQVTHALESCLAQGLAQEQIVVVDNASRDGTPELVRKHFPQVRLLVLERNLGFGAANNLAARHLPGDYLLLVNPDARLGSRALPTMLEALVASPKRGAISPRVDRPDGRLDAACRRTFPTPMSAFWRLAGVSRLLPRSARFGSYNLTHLPVDLATEIDSGTGACLLLRRWVWERVGGFDRRFYMYGEDLDLCWRIKELGLAVWYEPRARVLHLKGRSSEQVPLRMLVAFHWSMWRFYRIHYGRGLRALWSPLVALGVLLRLGWFLLLNSLRRHPTVSP
ncbi:MAG: glycosyltransferase family 2 protein [Candidatus Dormibacteria bacterium]